MSAWYTNWSSHQWAYYNGIKAELLYLYSHPNPEREAILAREQHRILVETKVYKNLLRTLKRKDAARRQRRYLQERRLRGGFHNTFFYPTYLQQIRQRPRGFKTPFDYGKYLLRLELQEF